MCPDQLIDACYRVGLRLERAGEDIRVRPKKKLTEELRAALRENKPQLIEALADREEAREERAAILQYDQELPREQAEAEARARVNWVSCATCANWTGETQCAAGLHTGGGYEKHRLRICGFHVPKDAR